MEPVSEAPALGIDLGTTYGCVGAWKDGRVVMIPNENGDYKTPLCVAFTETGKLVGAEAKSQADVNPDNTIFGVKRLIGRHFSDPHLQYGMKSWPFKVRPGPCDKPIVEVRFEGRTECFDAEEILAIFLARLKEAAEAFLQQRVTSALITVPGCFTSTQRQAVWSAGEMAGLHVLHVMNEHAAAALAYGGTDGAERRVLVFDLGGGTCDVTVVSIRDDVFEEVATAGDSSVGGEDMDSRLLNHCVQEFGWKNQKDISSDARALRMLRTECERAKRALSTKMQAAIEVECLHEGEDFATTITRAAFEGMCMQLFRRCIELVKKCLSDAGIGKGHIDDIFLVGGCTRIPKVQQLLQEFFRGKDPHIDVNPDEPVAHGAAVQAAILGGVEDASIQGIMVLDSISMSLGVETKGGHMCVMMPRHTRFPSRKDAVFSTTSDNQSSILLKIYEGEHPRARDCCFLWAVQLDGIAPAPRGVPRIEVAFSLDAQGRLSVSVNVASTEETATKTVVAISDLSSRMSNIMLSG